MAEPVAYKDLRIASLEDQLILLPSPEEPEQSHAGAGLSLEAENSVARRLGEATSIAG